LIRDLHDRARLAPLGATDFREHQVEERELLGVHEEHVVEVR
jgi:hypothetical protein